MSLATHVVTFLWLGEYYRLTKTVSAMSWSVGSSMRLVLQVLGFLDVFLGCVTVLVSHAGFQNGVSSIARAAIIVVVRAAIVVGCASEASHAGVVAMATVDVIFHTWRAHIV